MSILPVITLFLNLLPSVLEKLGYITPTLDQALTELGAAIPGVVTNVGLNQSAETNILEILDTIQKEVETLTDLPDAPAETLASIDSISRSLAAALNGYKEASVKTDPSALTPLPTDL